ncbi:MAG TPA: hypothetical protein VLF21_01275 [Candidatus Saccharimonadales bacterium]|nr:hypothetical protein [Candidatus Saccharimonadales bacterium]
MPTTATGNRLARKVAPDVGLTIEQMADILERSGLKEGSKISPEEFAKLESEASRKVTIDKLLGGFVAQGLRGIKPVYFATAYPALRRQGKVNGSTEIDPELEAIVRQDLTLLMDIDQQVETDQAALPTWNPPDPKVSMAQESQQGYYEYLGVCDHNVIANPRDVRRRGQRKDVRTSPFPRFCRDCLNARIRLMGQLSFAASASSRCIICGDPRFESEDAFFDSRSDIWENLVSGIADVPYLLVRLVAQHLETHPKHVARKEAFVEWVKEFDLAIAGQIAKYPAKAREIKARAEILKNEKRAELGLLVND